MGFLFDLPQMPSFQFCWNNLLGVSPSDLRKLMHYSISRLRAYTERMLRRSFDTRRICWYLCSRKDSVLPAISNICLHVK